MVEETDREKMTKREEGDTKGRTTVCVKEKVCGRRKSYVNVKKKDGFHRDEIPDTKGERPDDDNTIADPTTLRVDTERLNFISTLGLSL